MTLCVLDPGLASRVVDRGRLHSRGLGVPVGGAADVGSLALGNALVGNVPDAAALEVTLKGPILRAETETACVLFGAPFEVSSGRRRLSAGWTFTLSAGDELHVAGTPRGLRAYLCVAGGFEVPEILGSRSSFDNLTAGAELPCVPGKIRPRSLGQRQEAPLPEFSGELRVLPGLQRDWFREEEFYRQNFTISPAMNRMGLRLRGEPLTMPARELVSEPVCPGAVQVTRDGQCIILGVDGQTIGGYPKIAQVIEADLDRVGQLRPGMEIGFVPVDLAEARRLHLERQRRLQEWVLRLQLSLEIW